MRTVQVGRKSGMTLVEVIIAVSIIGLMAVMIVPAVQHSVRSRQNSRCASQLRRAIAAFELYRSENGAYPPDQNVPGDLSVSGMNPYFDDLGIDWWAEETELGGRWDWDVGYHSIPASISIWKPTASAKQLLEFDRLVDDNDLATGRFRKIETQYHYILEN
ncbi:MAG: type II secretion system protein [Kiritimatiellales bacterium]